MNPAVQEQVCIMRLGACMLANAAMSQSVALAAIFCCPLVQTSVLFIEWTLVVAWLSMYFLGPETIFQLKIETAKRFVIFDPQKGGV